jgi:hypothetical protein
MKNRYLALRRERETSEGAEEVDSEHVLKEHGFIRADKCP